MIIFFKREVILAVQAVDKIRSSEAHETMFTFTLKDVYVC